MGSIGSAIEWWTCDCGARHIVGITSPNDEFKIGKKQYCCITTFAKAAS